MPATADPAELLGSLTYYTLTTDSLIDWEKLAAARKPVEALAPESRCALFLCLVNAETLVPAEWSSLVGAAVDTGHPTHRIRLPEEVAVSLRAALLRVVENPSTALAAIGRNAAAIQNGNLVVIPDLAGSGRTWEIREHVVARSMGEALIYALWLFLDPAKAYGKALRVCGREGCGKFGFAPPRTTRGQPPTYFCSADHMKEQRRADSLRRVHKSRGKSVPNIRRHK